MYESYGDSLKDMVTYDGKIMALPETNITDGPNLVWPEKIGWIYSVVRATYCRRCR